MANPVVSNRVIPSGLRLDNGYQALVSFSAAPDLNIWEKSVQPFAGDGGDPIETDTQLNDYFITKKPQCLVSYDDAVIIAAYDPQYLGTIYAMINQEQSITWIFPDSTALAAFGYVRRVEPSPLVKNTQPEVTLTIVITNWDPVNCVEAGFVLVASTGVGCACPVPFEF